MNTLYIVKMAPTNETDNEGSESWSEEVIFK